MRIDLSVYYFFLNDENHSQSPNDNCENKNNQGFFNEWTSRAYRFQNGKTNSFLKLVSASSTMSSEFGFLERFDQSDTCWILSQSIMDKADLRFADDR